MQGLQSQRHVANGALAEPSKYDQKKSNIRPDCFIRWAQSHNGQLGTATASCVAVEIVATGKA